MAQFRSVDDLELAILWWKRRRDRPERGAGTEDSSVPMVETRWWWMSPSVMPWAYRLMITSSRLPNRRDPLGTGWGVTGCAGCRMRSPRSSLRATCGSRKSTSTPAPTRWPTPGGSSANPVEAERDARPPPGTTGRAHRRTPADRRRSGRRHPRRPPAPASPQPSTGTVHRKAECALRDHPALGR